MKTELGRLWQLAFGDSEEFIGFFFDTAYSPDRCRSITVDGQIAAALYWLDCTYQGQKLAYLYAVATHPGFRNRGLCRRLMEQTHKEISRRGYAGALLMPAEPELRQMYGKMGYRECCTIDEFFCRAGTPVSIREVDISEFPRLRRQYLPEGGVIQEGENLSYLRTYAKFYAGEDFLLTAAPLGQQLNGIELLGNKDAAPGILAALGYAGGTFRTPGADTPFAMFRPLREDVVRPEYLGFVFD